MLRAPWGACGIVALAVSTHTRDEQMSSSEGCLGLAIALPYHILIKLCVIYCFILSQEHLRHCLELHGQRYLHHPCQRPLAEVGDRCCMTCLCKSHQGSLHHFGGAQHSHAPAPSRYEDHACILEAGQQQLCRGKTRVLTPHPAHHRLL